MAFRRFPWPYNIDETDVRSMIKNGMKMTKPMMNKNRSADSR